MVDINFFIRNLLISAAVFVFFISLMVFGSVVGRGVVVLADCQSGSWACSPSGSAAGTVNGGGMYRCVDGLYRQQTACSMAAKCCVVNNVPKCIALTSTCGAPTPVPVPEPKPIPTPVEIPTVVIPFPLPAPAGPCSCDINSVDPKTCCKCDTGAFCLAASNSYRKCVNGCYRESACVADKTLCGQITELCAAQSAKCAKPGQATCGIQAGQTLQPGYLQLCQKENSCLSSNYQCGLNAGQKQQLADLFKLDNANLEVFDKAQYQTQDKDPNVVAKKKEFETQIIENIKTNPDLVRLLCLNFDYALSCGCDPELNPKYNDIKCTDVQSEVKPPVVKKTDCSPCNPGTVDDNTTFGCGEGLTQKDSSGIYAYKKCEFNTDTAVGAPKGCWGQSLACGKDNNVDGCNKFCANNTSGISIWDKSAAIMAICPKTLCLSSGAIQILDAALSSKTCIYKKSSDTKQTDCVKCHKDGATGEAACDMSTNKPKSAAINGVPVINGVTSRRGSDTFIIDANTNVEAECKIGTKDGGYVDLEWPMLSVKTSNSFNYNKSISCNEIKARLGSCDRGFSLYVICHNQNGDSLAVRADFLAEPAGADSKLSVSSLCVSGAALCGNACYNPKADQTCVNETIGCQSSSQKPEFKCNLNNAILKLEPKITSGGKDGVCDYSSYYICGFNQTCSDGKCVDNKDAPPQYVFCGQYDPATDGIKIVADDLKSSQIVDRNNGQAIQKQSKVFESADGKQVTIIGDKQGLDTLNAALALIASNSIKNKKWVEGKYVCENFAQDTEKMLRVNGIKDAYVASVNGVDTSGDWSGHAIIAIKVGEVKYLTGSMPIFAAIEPQTGVVMGQIGIDSGTQINNAYNDTSVMNEPFRIDNIAVIDNYEISSSNQELASDKTEIYTYTAKPPYIGDDNYLKTAGGRGFPLIINKSSPTP